MNVTKEELIVAIKGSKTKAEVLRKLGYVVHRSLYIKLDNLCAQYNIEPPNSRKKSQIGVIRALSEEELKNIHSNCTSIEQIMSRLNLKSSSARTLLSKRLRDLGLLYTRNRPQESYGKNNSKYISAEKYLGTSKNITNSKLKIKLFEEGILDNLCSACGIGPEYNNKPLTLELHHIDGDSKNNTLSNLKILCPNCHTQTDNYRSKNIKSITNV